MRCRFLNNDNGENFMQGRREQVAYNEGQAACGRRCKDCGHVFFETPPSDVLKKYYEEVFPVSEKYWYNVENDYKEERVKYSAQRVIDIAKRFGLGASHLYHDVGCGFGGKVHELNRRGYSATGTELSAMAIQEGREHKGNTAIYAEEDIAFLQRTGRKPNVVYGYHVLEHLTDPVSYLRNLMTCLAEEAIVIMFVPNVMALFPNVYGFDKYGWYAYPAHLNYFSPHSVGCLAKKTGYEILDVWSSYCGIKPEETTRALGSQLETPVANRIRNYLIEQGLMAEELVFVLTPRQSPIALRNRPAIAKATVRCEANRAFELEMRQMAENSATPDMLKATS